MTTLRKYPAIPVFVVEDHNEVLPHIYRAIGSKHLPFEGNLLIHFDAHPDLLLPTKNFHEEDAWDKDRVFNSTSIETWILPGCYTGQFSKVCWIKPPWSKQIPEGLHDIDIGHVNNHIRVGADLYYFISDGIMVDRHQLTNRKMFKLNVSTMSLTSTSQDLVPKSFFREHKEYILDIDLDFFSVNNPFIDMLGDSYEKLRPLFKFNCPEERTYEETAKISQQRFAQMKRLSQLFDNVESIGGSTYLEQASTDASEGESVDNVTSEECLYPYGCMTSAAVPTLVPKQSSDDEDPVKRTKSAIHSTIESAVTNPTHQEILQSITDEVIEAKTVPISILFSAGCTLDETELPRHISTEEELEQLMMQFRVFLQNLPHAPTIVTIARSSDDDYCPVEHVDDIQRMTIECLQKQFGKLDVHLSYLEN